MNKKILSLVLILVFVFAFAVGTYAASECPICGGPTTSHSCCNYMGGHDWEQTDFTICHTCNKIIERHECTRCDRVKHVWYCTH